MRLEFTKEEGVVMLEKGSTTLRKGDIIDVTEKFGTHLLKTNKDFRRVEKSKKRKEVKEE